MSTSLFLHIAWLVHIIIMPRWGSLLLKRVDKELYYSNWKQKKHDSVQ